MTRKVGVISDEPALICTTFCTTIRAPPPRLLSYGIPIMQILTFSEARANLKQTMDDVCRDHEPAVITRQRGEPVVVMSLEDYNSMAETVYLLGNEKNAAWLRESIAQHKAGKVLTREMSLNVPTED